MDNLYGTKPVSIGLVIFAVSKISGDSGPWIRLSAVVELCGLSLLKSISSFFFIIPSSHYGNEVRYWIDIHKSIAGYFVLSSKHCYSAVCVGVCVDCSPDCTTTLYLGNTPYIYWTRKGQPASKARFPLYPSWRPELTARIDGWPVSITRQHGPCWWSRVSTSRVDGQLGPLTRAVNSGIVETGL